MKNTEKMYISLSEAASMTGISYSTIRKGVLEHNIPHIKIGAKHMIHWPMWKEMLMTETRESMNK